MNIRERIKKFFKRTKPTAPQSAEEFFKDMDVKQKKEYARRIIEANKWINEESNRLITWSISVIGGSIAVIISTGYVNPTGVIVYAYGLFAIGWVYLAFSIYYGERITRIYIAGRFSPTTDAENIRQGGIELQESFWKQLIFFRYGIFTFGAWLLFFLAWYISSKI